MASRSFRIFATKEDLLAIFLEFQSNMKVHYFECGRSNKLTEAQDITKEEFFGVKKLSASITNADNEAKRADVKKWRNEMNNNILNE